MVGETSPAGVEMGQWKSQSLSVRKPAKQVGADWISGEPAKCDDMEQHGEFRELQSGAQHG